MSKPLPEIIVVTQKQFDNEYFVFPSAYFFKNALGDYIFIKTIKREKAQQYLDTEYDGLYSLRCVKATPGKRGDVTAVGTATRKGQRKY